MENIYSDFLRGIASMIGNYAERNIDRTEIDDFVVDTTIVTDRPWKYETAINHPAFNDGEWVIVGGVNNEEKAREEHNHWVDILKTGKIFMVEDIATGEVYVKREPAIEVEEEEFDDDIE